MTELPKRLGDDLVMRRATAADGDELAAFNQRVHGEPGIDAWTRDLMEKPHPAFRLEDFTIVEDQSSRAIVSSLNLIPQTWTYRGVPFAAGRIELVGTDPDYRRRGLVRAQMEVAHAWCRERGLLVQGITGVPHYYRRFGYEMAVEMMSGRTGPSAAVPKLGDDDPEPYTLRPATGEDAAFCAEVQAGVADRYVVADPWDETYWRSPIATWSPTPGTRRTGATRSRAARKRA